MDHLDSFTADQLKNRISGAELDIQENTLIIEACRERLAALPPTAFILSPVDMIATALSRLDAVEYLMSREIERGSGVNLHQRIGEGVSIILESVTEDIRAALAKL